MTRGEKSTKERLAAVVARSVNVAERRVEVAKRLLVAVGKDGVGSVSLTNSHIISCSRELKTYSVMEVWAVSTYIVLHAQG